MTAHKHAELMLQYAQDAAETEEPWLRWEVRSNSKDPWRSGSRRICFDSTCEYRRKPRTMTYTITIQGPTREAPTMLAWFGVTFDIFTGRARNWYQSAGDVKRWADNDEPVEEIQQ